MKLVVATESSTLMRWCRASLLASPTVLPASMVPWRWIAPVRARIASKSVVLPLWNGPTSATQRGPVDIVPGLALHRKRLQRHRTVRTADQHVGTQARGNGGFSRRAHIGSGQHAGIEIGAGEHAPDDGAAAGDADVEADARQCSDIGLGRSAPGLEVASHITRRRDDHADAGRQRAFERAALHAVLLRAGRNSQYGCERCGTQHCANGIAKHMETPLTRPA